MTTQPLIDYLEARDYLLRGDRAEAIASLERALGSQPGNPVIARSLELLLDYQSLPGEVALGILRTELRKPTRDRP